ncbi:MAG: SDR family oxidoreductase [Proteobacteria bacterium]|nr:SDR family oxidoreductase [Pseudomonadota bacterium]MDA1136735.1 SDR family oxidoreductase [Pseudomonadota bacterium]
MFNLSGKIALITGSSRGLGLSIAKALFNSGATIIINGRNQETLDKASKKINHNESKIYKRPFDITNIDDIHKNISNIKKEIGTIDILVNNAGIQSRELLTEIKIRDWDNVLKTNLTSPFILSQAIVPGMIEKKAGKIINICSITSEVTRPSIAPYVSAKGGLKMLTKAMAVEWAQYNIQVNGIGPGLFKTEMNTALVEDKKFNKWVCERTPAGRWGEPDELSGVAVLLASKASSYINGQIIYVDGGFLSSM